MSIEANGSRLDELSFPGRQGRLIFAYLLAEEGRAVPRDELAEVLWGDALPATWEKALSVLVSKLRVLLEQCGIDAHAALQSAFGCYQLTLPSGAWIDVAAAREAVDRSEAELEAGDLATARVAAGEAVALARRSFLPGEDGLWIQERRRELSELLVRALACLSDASLAGGDAREAVRRAEELTVLEPYREGGYRRLMQAHATAGDSAEALRVYERCRRLLADELGAYPSPETESIYRELLRAPPPPNRVALETGAAAPAAERPPARAGAVSRIRGRRVQLAFGAVVLSVTAVAASVATFAGGDATESRTAAPNSVAVIDPGTTRLVADISVGTGPTSVSAGDGAVWVTNTADQTVDRIDLGSRSVRQTVRVGDGPSAIAAGGGAVWVANGLAGTLSRIDAKTNQVVQTITVGNSPAAVAFGEGAVWVANAGDRTLSRLNPSSGRVDEPIPVEAPARGIAVGGGAVWLSDPVGNAVVRLDPRTRTVTGRVGVGSGPTAVAYGFGAVWVANNLDGTVSRIDAKRAVVVDTIPVGAAPSGIVVAGDAVWVTDEVAGTLIRIDPRSGTPTRRPLGGRPKGLAYADGSLWVAVQPGDAAHRGGTLRLLTEDSVGLPDPTRAFGALDRSLLSVTSDGLVGFKRVGGVEGNTVVPDLATALPVPTEGGRTYTFRLREGVRFSTGRPVRASDVRFTMERVFKASSPGLDVYAGIVGGRACKQRPRRCDLSGGVVVDDAARTVTFRLREPDPEFVYKLALPFALVVPSGTPLPGARPVPGTGPYRTERYEPGLIRLVRNRYFRAWSSAAQPPGVADAIELRGPLTNRAQVEVLRDMRADVSDLSTSGVPDDLLDDVRTRYPAQVRITPVAATVFAQPNTTRPPFSSVAARRAVAFAVDRARMVELASGSIVQPTCQILPPNSPGYRPYCPHTARPGGSWTRPDLARARELVRRSGTRGMRVDMITESSPLFSSAAEVVTDALRLLGYRVSLRTYPDFGAYFDAYGSVADSVELAFNGWIEDYPAPSSFITGLFACNPYFCDRAVDARARRLLALQAREPQTAGGQWAQLERELVERAIAVPLANPKQVVFVSKRVGNFQHHPVLGTLIGQLWVR